MINFILVVLGREKDGEEIIRTIFLTPIMKEFELTG